MRRVGFALALVAGMVAATSAPAFAATPTAQILHVDTANGEISILMSAVGLTVGQQLDLNSATLTLDNTSLPARAVLVGSSRSQVTRTVILAFDISGSMQGAPLTAAKAAAHTFASLVPADVRIGLVAFGSTASVVTPPTTDRRRLLTSIDALTTKGETALYDGMLLALATAGTSGARSVVVLSDGADTVSKHKASEVTAKMKSGILVDAVPFATSDAQTKTLAAWATASGGRYLKAADTSQLAAAFASAAADASNQVVLTATIPAAVAGHSVNISASISDGTSVLTATSFASLPAGPTTSTSGAASPAPAPTASRVPAGPIEEALPAPRVAPHTVLYGGLAAMFVALIVVVAYVLGIGRGSTTGTRVQDQMAVYSLKRRGFRKEPQPSRLGDNSVARSAVELADRVALARGFDGSLRRKLEAAGVPLRPGEWVILHLGVTFASAFVLLALSGGKPLPALIGLVIGALLPGAYLSVKEGRRKAKFSSQLPEMLQLVAGSLSAGFSLGQAFDTAAREGAAPMSIELNRALVQGRLGMPLEDALEAIGDRMQSKDFAWVVMAIRIQRDVGGNLAEVLTTVAETLRERERLRRQVNVLSAEGKLSGYILFALPVFMALYMIVVRPTYIGVLIKTPIGIALIIVGISLQAAGAFWMKKVTTVEV